MRGHPASPWTRARLTLAALLPLGLTAAAAPIAYVAMFSLFQPYDDEGYLLISLKGYLGGHALYEEVFSQYGPFYYLLNGSLFRLLGLDVTHDAGRLFTLALWLLAALIGGAALIRLTRSVLLGVVGQVLFFGALSTLVNEPMHPGALLGLLLVTTVLVVVGLVPRRQRAAMLILGALAGATALVKVNVGAFVLVSLGATLFLTAPPLSRSVILKGLAAAALVGTPFAVMARDLDTRWAASYAVLVGLAALALLLVALRSLPDRIDGLRTLAWFAGGIVAVIVLVTAVTMAMGTSPSALIDGALLRPLRQPEAFSLPFPMPGWAPVAGVAGVAMAALVAWRPRVPMSDRASEILGAGGRVAAGLIVWVSVATVGRVPGSPLSLALPLAWIAAVPPTRDSAPVPTFVRLALPSLAVLQALHAYPVAGSQMAWSGMLLIPVGAMCIADGWAVMAAWSRSSETIVHRPIIRALAGLPVAGFTAWLLLSSFVPFAQGGLQAYDQGVQPRLPGVSRFRIGGPQVQLYEELASTLRTRCSTFISAPGLNSLYLFSGLEPPTYLNTTAWMYLFDARVQERVVQRISRIEGLCTVRSDSLVSFWSQGRPIPPGPLVTLAFRDLPRIRRLGEYSIFRDAIKPGSGDS